VLFLVAVLPSLPGHDADHTPSLFVTRFPSNTTASQLNKFHKEVTGILRSIRPGDETLLVLQSNSGAVIGYSIAAGQLLRFKPTGTNLTVRMEQVDACVGNMLCCTANQIVANPFTVLCRIGVISKANNTYKWPQRKGVEFLTIIKWTVTPIKKITKEDIRKTTNDTTEIFDMFKGFGLFKGFTGS
jgi:serine protease SohB